MGAAATPDLWRIYFVERCGYTRPEPKDKLVVIVCKDDDYWGFLINTKIDKWIQIDRAKMSAQARILEEDHSQCLDYDSWVDCLDIYRFEEHQLSQPRELVSDRAKAEICEAVENSKTLIQKHKQMVLAHCP